jgi:hypothetical protein
MALYYMERIVKSAQDKDHMALGAYYVLGALTLVKDSLTPSAATPSLFDPVLPKPSESVKNSLPEQTIIQSNLRKPKESGLADRTSVDPAPISPFIPSTYLEKKIERVLIFYTDGTFSESKPQN